MKTISIKWSTYDILVKANDLEIEITEKQADKILDDIERQHDASIGINWDVIASHLYDFQQDEKEKKNGNV